MMLKKLTLMLRKSGGRNATGRICSFHIGGGHRQRYRIIDFARRVDNTPTIVRTIEHDPSRSAFISLMLSEAGSLFYIIASEGIRIGDVIISGNKNAVMIGSSMRLLDIPLGYYVHNVCANEGENDLARSAGCYAQILKKTQKQALLKLPSGKHIRVDLRGTATIGKVSNPKHLYKIYNKAGKSRWLGKTPVVRGVAMNPVDHPMGGKTHGKLHRTPWGNLAKGVKTRNKNKFNYGI